MQNRRTERGAFYPPFWRLYSHYNLLDFSKTYTINANEEIEIFTEGKYNLDEQKYDLEVKGDAHYAMYGRPFGKSLCHAWGASPICLLGKYYLGIRPLAPGYQKFLVKPNLGGLKWIEGEVPVPGRNIHVLL
jgi:hypothetical protein